MSKRMKVVRALACGGGWESKGFVEADVLPYLSRVQVSLILQLCNLDARCVAMARRVALVVDQDLILELVVFNLQPLNSKPLLLLHEVVVRCKYSRKGEVEGKAEKKGKE